MNSLSKTNMQMMMTMMLGKISTIIKAALKKISKINDQINSFLNRQTLPIDQWIGSQKIRNYKKTKTIMLKKKVRLKRVQTNCVKNLNSNFHFRFKRIPNSSKMILSYCIE